MPFYEEPEKFNQVVRDFVLGLDEKSSGPMNQGKRFVNVVANGETDVIEILLGLLLETGSSYCVIGVRAQYQPVDRRIRPAHTDPNRRPVPAVCFSR